MNSRQVRSFHDDKLELSCRIGAFTLRVVLFWTWSLHRFGGVLILSTCETWTILNLATVLVCPNIGPPKSCPKKNYPGTKRYIFRWLVFHVSFSFGKRIVGTFSSQQLSHSYQLRWPRKWWHLLYALGRLRHDLRYDHHLSCALAVADFS